MSEQTVEGDVENQAQKQGSRARRFSYGVLILTLLLAAIFGLGTPLVAILFSYVALMHLRFLRRKTLEVIVFALLVMAICAGLGTLLGQAVKHLPRVAEKAIPTAIQTAEKYNWDLPFSDWASLKVYAVENVKTELGAIGGAAKRGTRHFVFLILGVVIAASIFINPFALAQSRGGGPPNTVYAVYGNEIVARFRDFYDSFKTVMGAQLIISAINTALTAIFILSVGMPLPALGIGATFLCGIFPIVGNLMSNSILVAIALTRSLEMALWALIFLIVLHKLEYFLNSKIIGRHIKTPVWLTLIGLIIGERLMGIPGLILAPVILDYVRREASRFKAREATQALPETGQ
jgi:predicted PurR-regulated permease PerM